MTKTQFRMRADSLSAIRRKLLTRLVVSVVVITAVSVLICYQNGCAATHRISAVAVPAVLATAAFTAITTVSLRLQKKLLTSYILTVENGFIVREQANTPPLAFSYEDVSGIERTSGGGYLILCSPTNELILVPPQIERHEELELLLNAVSPVAYPRGAKIRVHVRPYAAAIVIALLLMLLTARPAWMILSAGALLIPATAYAFVAIRRSSVLPAWLKNLSWILPAAIVAMAWWMWYRIP